VVSGIVEHVLALRRALEVVIVESVHGAASHALAHILPVHSMIICVVLICELVP